MMITASGHNGTVTFDGRAISIIRSGFLARATLGKGEKRIPLASISAVQFKPAGPIVNGYIEFTVPGGNETRSRTGSATKDAGHNENAVIFTRKQMPAFEDLRRAVDEAQTTPAPAAGAPSLAAQIAELGQLHAQGILSAQEFDAAKARLIG